MSTITVSQSSHHWCQYSNINNNRQVNIYIQDRPNQHYCKVQILAGPGVPGGENDNKYFFKATGEYFHTRSVQVNRQYVRVSSVYWRCQEWSLQIFEQFLECDYGVHIFPVVWYVADDTGYPQTTVEKGEKFSQILSQILFFVQTWRKLPWTWGKYINFT